MTRHSVIVDLDGTLIDLNVDWAELRRDLGVRSVRDLWSRNDGSAWDEVSAAELAAARTSDLNVGLATALQSVPRVAILSNNSVEAVHETVRRIGGHADRWVVIGRESLGAPKEDRSAFDSAIRRITRCWKTSPEESWYVGDAAYEIEYARQLGMRTWHMTDWTESLMPEGFVYA